MAIKEAYYKLSKEDFDLYLSSLKKDLYTIHLLDNKFYYKPSFFLTNKILILNNLINKYDNLVSKLSPFIKTELLYNYIISEIVSTNNIENIPSTKEEVFSIINNTNHKYKDNEYKLISICESYIHLLDDNILINDIKDIRTIYDKLLNNAIDDNDKLDGELFRKNMVYITDGINSIHNGLYPESEIIKGLNEFIIIYNNKDISLYERLILSHFMFEYIHPFYDGNGRCGRFLFTYKLYKESRSFFSFIISSIFNKYKSKYYKLFKTDSDTHEFNFLNQYVSDFLDLLIQGIQDNINELEEKIERINNINIDNRLINKEIDIYKIIIESSIFSINGITNDTIIKNLNISKRTLEYGLNKLNDLNLIENIKIGKKIFHKIKD